MTLDAVLPVSSPALPVAQDIGQYDPFPRPPEQGQPVPAEAHWALNLDPGNGAAVFQSNTPVRVRIFTAAFSTSREQGPDRISSWMLQGESDGPTTSWTLPLNYEAYLELAQQRSDVWGVMAIAVLSDPAGNPVATGDPVESPSGTLLRIFAVITDLQGL